MLGHKTILNKFKNTEIIQTIFSGHNGMKPENKSRMDIGKLMNIWILNNTFLNNKWVKEDKKEKLRNVLRQAKTQHTKIYEMKQKQY